MTEKVCKQCKRIVEDSSECPVCKNNDLSDSWSGVVVIYDPEGSEIADRLEIETPGKYAIRAR